MIELINKTQKEFLDISSEQYRIYHFSKGESFIIDNPIYLNTSENGHRVLCDNGKCFYIPNNWLSIEWKPKEGQPHFVK
jgi:hypothetical protein